MIKQSPLTNNCSHSVHKKGGIIFFKKFSDRSFSEVKKKAEADKDKIEAMAEAEDCRGA